MPYYPCFVIWHIQLVDDDEITLCVLDRERRADAKAAGEESISEGGDGSLRTYSRTFLGNSISCDRGMAP